MNIEVYLTGSIVTDEDIKDRLVIVIDVLRTSTTVVTALHHGARAVVPVRDMAEAGKIAANLDPASYLMGGERGGEHIEGYHLGNSPLEYDRETVEGRTIILNTTNGTPAIAQASTAAQLVVGGFINAGRVVAFAQDAALDIALVCAGWRNRVSLEDTLCAGMLLHRLWAGAAPSYVSDTAHIAFTQYFNDKDSLLDALRQCNHAKRLRQQGREEDLGVCFQVDTLPLLPIYADNRLILHENHSPAEAVSTAKPRINVSNLAQNN